MDDLPPPLPPTPETVPTFSIPSPPSSSTGSPISTPTPSARISHSGPANSTATKAVRVVKIFQAIVSNQDTIISLLETEKRAYKAQNEELKWQMEAMETQMRVLREALHLQLQPKVEVERIRKSPEAGLRGPSSFGSVASARIAGLERDSVSEVEVLGIVPAAAFIGEASSEPAISTVATRPVSTAAPPEQAARVAGTVSMAVEDGKVTAGEEAGGTKSSRMKAKRAVLKPKKNKVTPKTDDGKTMREIFYEYWW